MIDMKEIRLGDIVDINGIRFIAVNPLQEDSCLGCELDSLAGNLHPDDDCVNYIKDCPKCPDRLIFAKYDDCIEQSKKIRQETGLGLARCRKGFCECYGELGDCSDEDRFAAIRKKVGEKWRGVWTVSKG